MAVDRCICQQISFRDILKKARRDGFSSTGELREAGISCTNCRLCEPYIERMLETGQTSFEPVTPNRETRS